jgi:hypothetical protein
MLSLIDKIAENGGQFPPEWRWSVCSGILPESALFTGGQFAPESGGQFDRILQSDRVP